MAAVHEAIAVASHFNAIGRDQQALVGVRKEVHLLTERLYTLEDQLDELDEDTNPAKRERLKSRHKHVQEELEEQRELYIELKRDIRDRRYTLSYNGNGNGEEEEEEEDE